MVRPKKEELTGIRGGAQENFGCFRVAYPYGFIDGFGVHQFWNARQIVRNIEELELLRARGVDLQED